MRIRPGFVRLTGASLSTNKVTGLKILFASSEAIPLIKTGGLADVSGSLPLALNDAGVDARLVLPAYPNTQECLNDVKELTSINLIGSVNPVRLLRGTLKDKSLTVYLIDAPGLLDRVGNPYCTPEGTDWPDNAERFCVFSRAVAVLALGLGNTGWKPDVVHCNDWQTALVPALLSVQKDRPATIFTIHNLSYQGLFPKQTFDRLELPDAFWSPDALEFFGKMSFIKGGLIYADQITTVSPTYKKEICTREFGYGLEGILAARAGNLHGILNGVDYSIWDPEHDPLIKKNYSSTSFTMNKLDNKKELQKQFSLPLNSNVAMIGLVGRLVEQKGIDLVLDILKETLQMNVQLVILGTGEPTYEKSLLMIQQENPEKLGIQINYCEKTAHLIEAGADIFLMPSRFEPCGLNQIYSLRYGTIPIVRKTGGLADTVVDPNNSTINNETATGFVFQQANSASLLGTLKRALDLYTNRTKWRKLMRNAMQQEFSWKTSAKDYIKVYKLAAK